MDVLERSRKPLVPPRGLRFVGDGDYEETGRQVARQLAELGGLKPSDRVLDVGCGSGRIAAALTGYLTSGSYEGFDIIKPGITWATKHITSRFPNFRFTHADIHNTHYNPSGKFSSATWKFPYPDHSFDFAFLTSVFTHMLAENVENYFSELHRVLKPNGTCFATCFLLNEESNRLIAEGKSKIPLTHRLDRYAVYDLNSPEIAIGFDDDLMMEIVARTGFSNPVITLGSWCGRQTDATFQDIMNLKNC